MWSCLFVGAWSHHHAPSGSGARNEKGGGGANCKFHVMQPIDSTFHVRSKDLGGWMYGEPFEKLMDPKVESKVNEGVCTCSEPLKKFMNSKINF